MLNIVDLAGSERAGQMKIKNINLAKLKLDNLSPRSGSVMELGSVYTPSPSKINRGGKTGTNKK